MYNQHGIVPSNGWLISQSGRTSITWNFIDPLTGKNASMVVENVPSGTEVLGPTGENLRYVWNSAGKWLAQWNSSKVFNTQSSGTRDASDPDSYDWNVTISSVGDGSWSIYRDVVFENILLLIQGNLGAGNLQPSSGATITAISLDPDQRGHKLWDKYYPPAPGNTTREIIQLDADAGVFVTQDKETMECRGFSLSDGSLIWTSSQVVAEFDTLRSTSLAAYGNLYSAGFDGICYCYDMATGDLLWTYGNGGEGNSTNAGLDTAWGHYPIFVDILADGKIYLGTTEHSPGSPFYKNTQYRCLNATTGEEIWTMMGWGTGMYVGRYDVMRTGSLYISTATTCKFIV
jgi:outer membrane protein assembly factor BamB